MSTATTRSNTGSSSMGNPSGRSSNKPVEAAEGNQEGEISGSYLTHDIKKGCKRGYVSGMMRNSPLKKFVKTNNFGSSR